MKKTIGKIPVSFIREKKSIVAYSEALDISTCGRTLGEAKQNFFEAVEILFEECQKTNTLDQVLADCGWVKVHKAWQPPIKLSEELIDIRAMA